MINIELRVEMNAEALRFIPLAAVHTILLLILIL